MNLTEIQEYAHSFEKKTWVEIFKAIEQEWILQWLWLARNYHEIYEKIQENSFYVRRLDNLQAFLIKRKNKKKFVITEQDVKIAFVKTLNNCSIWTLPHRKDFRYSEWLLSDYQAKDVCQKDNNTLNPFFYAALWTESGIKPRSIFEDPSIKLQTLAKKNGRYRGRQRYREEISIATPGMYYISSPTKIYKSLYHPLVWYLLSENTLHEYFNTDLQRALWEEAEKIKIKQDKILASE